MEVSIGGIEFEDDEIEVVGIDIDLDGMGANNNCLSVDIANPFDGEMVTEEVNDTASKSISRLYDLLNFEEEEVEAEVTLLVVDESKLVFRRSQRAIFPTISLTIS
jgi:hypothetical protein